MEDALEHHKKVSELPISSDAFTWLLLICMCAQHLEATKELENPYGQAIALSNIARAYEYTNNFNKASEAMEQVHPFFVCVN